MGNALRDRNENEKRPLIAKAYASISEGGMFIAIKNAIDDARREAAFGLLMSLNMLIEVPGGFEYTGAPFGGWCREAGFNRTGIIPRPGPTCEVIAYR